MCIVYARVGVSSLMVNMGHRGVFWWVLVVGRWGFWLKWSK